MGGSLTVPYPFDVIIDGQGYVLYDGEENKAAFGLTPVFTPRTNTDANYGDNQQDFWLTWTQKDWSKGDQQKWQRRDKEPEDRFWKDSAADVRTAGEVSMRKATTALSFAANPDTAIGDTFNDRVRVATSTNLYGVDYAGTITDHGAHGLGAAPSRFGVAHDGGRLYLTTTAGGTVGVRNWDGAAFGTFSATASDALAYLNNTLYGYSAGILRRYDTAGTATTIFTWQGATGAALQPSEYKLLAFGGKLLILRGRLERAASLWLYEGSAPAKIAEFPANFRPYDIEILNGTVFVSGMIEKTISGTVYGRPTIYFYKDGTQDIFWQAVQHTSSSSTSAPALAVFDGGLVWQDLTSFSSGQVVYYNPATGGTSFIGAGGSPATPLLVSAATFFITAPTSGAGTAGVLYPASSDAAVSTTDVYSSLIDFDTSLRKIFRGVRVEFTAGSDGNGGSVDILYRFNDVDSTYTSLQTSVTSGTEYNFPTPAEGTNYQSVSIQVTLNKGTSTNGPVLKRVQVRAVPVQPAFKKRQYVLHLGGRDGESHVKLRDNTLHALDGLQMATNLQTAASRSSPFAIVDHLSPSPGYTGVLESVEMREYKPEEFIAVVTARSV